MPGTSTAYVLVKSLGWRYSFDGVTSVSHSLSLCKHKHSVRAHQKAPFVDALCFTPVIL